MHHLPEMLEFERKTSEDSKSNPDFATNINGGHWVSMLDRFLEKSSWPSSI